MSQNVNKSEEPRESINPNSCCSGNGFVHVDQEAKRVKHPNANILPPADTDEKVMEISPVAAIGRHVDTLTDALMSRIDLMVTDALGK